MRAILVCWIGLGVLGFSWAGWAEEAGEMPRPREEHAWLKRFVGEWETESEIYMGPGQPPLVKKGTETARMLGGFWMVANVKGDYLGQPYEALLTLGYDEEKQKYVGTWIDSLNDYQVNYVGTVDADSNTLTLRTRGPNPARPGELVNVRQVFEFKNENERVFTSSVQEEDGEWTKLVTVRYRRKE